MQRFYLVVKHQLGMVGWLHDLMSLNFRRPTNCHLQLKPRLCKMCTIQTQNFPSLNRGPVQRHDVRLPLHGALGLPGPRHQRAVGGSCSDCEGWLRGTRLDRRRPRGGPQGEPNQPSQTLPGRAGAALLWPRPGPRSGSLQGDEPSQGQQDPPPEVPLLPWPQCTVTHTHADKETHSYTCTHKIENFGGWEVWSMMEKKWTVHSTKIINRGTRRSWKRLTRDI